MDRLRAVLGGLLQLHNQLPPVATRLQPVFRAIFEVKFIKYYVQLCTWEIKTFII
jgi:hypothetical protein